MVHTCTDKHGDTSQVCKVKKSGMLYLVSKVFSFNAVNTHRKCRVKMPPRKTVNRKLCD